MDARLDPAQEAGLVEGDAHVKNNSQFAQRANCLDLAQSVYEDVLRIRLHPLVPPQIPIHGYIYDVKTGKLIEVPEVSKVGKAPSHE